MNFYGHYIGDYQRDTADLSLLEHGAYRLLLDAYYATEGPLPADPARLFRIAKAVTAPEQEAVEHVADRFFPVGADGLRHNSRADRELVAAHERIEVARNNGRRGGRPKKETHEKPSGFFTETQRVSQKEPSGLTSQSQCQGTTTTPTADARERVTAAANRGLDEQYGTGHRILVPSTAEWLEPLLVEGMPVEVAESAVYDMAGRTTRRPSSMRYFAPGVREAWERERARRAAVEAGTPVPLTRPMRSTGPNQSRQDRNLAAITEGLRRYGNGES